MMMRLTAMPDAPRRLPRVVLAWVLLVLLVLASWPAWAAGTLDKVRSSGRLTIGYVSDMRPFAYADASGKPSGYAVALCAKVADAVRAELKQPSLAVDFSPLPRDEALRAVDQGKVDLLCGAVPTLERRALVDFSIPILVSGAGVAVRADAPARLVQALSGKAPSDHPLWRASPDQAPQHGVLAVTGGTTLEKALVDQLKERRIVADVVPVATTEAGLQMLADRKADAFFSDRAVLLDAASRSATHGGVVVLDRLFRRDLVALAMRRNDDDFRLLVDRTLSQLYRRQEVMALYADHFGTPGAATQDFFNLVALPD
jgi:ABC-type amino acid transport substrate-binding protein